MNNGSIFSTCRYCFKTIIKIVLLLTIKNILLQKAYLWYKQTIEVIPICLHLNIQLNLHVYQSKSNSLISLKFLSFENLHFVQANKDMNKEQLHLLSKNKVDFNSKDSFVDS